MDLTELKGLVDGLRSDWAELQRTNAERIKQEVKGVVDPLITEKLAKINESLDKRQASYDTINAKMQSDIKRIEAGVEPGVDVAAEQKALARFNIELRAGAIEKGRALPAAVGVEEFRLYRSGFQTYVRRGFDALSDVERRAMSVGSDPDGGYLVTPDTSGRVVTMMRDTSPILQFAAVQNISTDALEGLRDTDQATSGGWVSETATRSTSATPQIFKWAIPVHEQFAQPAATQKLLDDAGINVETWLGDKVAEVLGRTANTAYAVGNGVGKPRGFASYTGAATADASRAWGVPEYIVSGTNGTFGTDPTGIEKLSTLLDTLNERYIPGAAWYANRVTRAKMRLLTDASSAGKYVFIPSWVSGGEDSLLGHPVRLMADMVAYTTTDAYGVALADMKQAYQVVLRTGIRVLRDPFTSKPYVLLYTTVRVGGDVIDFNAIKFLKFGTS